MQKEKKLEFEALIASEISKTLKNIVDFKEMTQPIAPDDAIGRVSRMDAINNKSVAEAGLRQAEEKLNKLEFALSKVDSDEFGVCRRCGGDIPLGRLALMPQSLYCVKCAK
ncbi:MAG: TraR/DksA family transcriptional regulator [Bacteroidetes bacterium HGW-Bacteroidetes-15]|nr:MAG: TraR/DksA family transcriptional regulator [Bacteroidetes bacterium HGW-Bacteroidetes-15]